jgi:YjzC-like protein
MKREVFMSGEKAVETGIFAVINHAPNHPQQIDIKKGEEFPRCTSCKQSVKYRPAAK